MKRQRGELTQTGRVDGLHRLLHLVQDAAVDVQSLNTETQRCSAIVAEAAGVCYLNAKYNNSISHP